MRTKNIYYAWANNDHGTIIDVSYRGHNKREAADTARSQLGSGWQVHIMLVGIDGDGQSTFEPVEVETFYTR